MEREVLSEVNRVYRIGERVERTTQPWSLSVYRLLKHFESFNLPVERILSVNDKVQISEYLNGEMVHPQKWTDDALFKVGALVARLHNASKDFQETDRDIWQPWYLREIGGNQRIHCHGDIAPWNMITENGYPKLLVDWEFAGPLDPLVELARVCWLFVQLHDDDLQKIYDLPSPQKRAEQVRIVTEGYGLPSTDRKRLVDQIIEVIICETAHEAIDPGLTFDSHGMLWGFAWRTRSLYWVWRHRDIIRKALD
jgi:thiamine kinase-like enzyme